MGKRFAAFAVAAVILLFAVSTWAMAKPTYTRLLRYATRDGRIFSFETWDAKLIWNVTFFDESFRAAFEDKSIKVNHLDENEAAHFVAEQSRRQQNGWDFFIGFYTKKEYKKFSTDSDTFWKIRLVTASGKTIHPDSIEPIPITPYERVMYPYLNRWSKAYRVTFPKVDLGKEFVVTINSVEGESRLKWMND